MTRSSQNDYKKALNAGSGSLLGRIFAFVIGIGVLAVSIFLGAIFMAAALGFILIIAIVIAIRVWWLRRKMERYERENGDLTAEYTVVQEREERYREIDRR